MLRLIKTHPFKDLFTSGSGRFNVCRVDIVQSHAECFATCPSPATKNDSAKLTHGSCEEPLLRLSRPTWDPRPKFAATAIQALDQPKIYLILVSPADLHCTCYSSNNNCGVAWHSRMSSMQPHKPTNLNSQSTCFVFFNPPPPQVQNRVASLHNFNCFWPEPKLGKCVGRSVALGTLALLQSSALALYRHNSECATWRPVLVGACGLRCVQSPSSLHRSSPHER